jgi:hypothetical protein
MKSADLFYRGYQFSDDDPGVVNAAFASADQWLADTLVKLHETGELDVMELGARVAAGIAIEDELVIVGRAHTAAVVARTRRP